MSRGKKRVAIVVGLLVVAVIIGAKVASGGEAKTMVYTSPVERLTSLKAIVQASGEIQPKDSIDIQAEIQGVIVDLPVKEGDSVKKGQVLLRIDPIATQAETSAMRAAASEAEAQEKGEEVQIAMSEASLAGDESQLQTSKLELVQAEATLQRAQDAFVRRQKLFDQQLISADDMEIAKNTVDVNSAARDAAASRVTQYEALLRANKIALDQRTALRDAAKNRVEAAQANLARAEDTLRKTTIYAPQDGIITKRNVEVGERAVPGTLDNPLATLMTISDMSYIEAQIKVDETDVVQISLGDEAVIEVDALPDRKLKGVVTEIANSPLNSAATSGNQAATVKDFLVKLHVEDPPIELRPGLSCSAEITTEVREDALVIPIQSYTARDLVLDAAGKPIVPTPADIDKQKAADAAGTPAAATVRQKTEATPGVFVRGADDRAEFRPVKIGIAGQTDYEVLEGLKGGEEVVSGPYKVLRTIEVGDRLQVDNSRQFRASGDRAKSD
jgi:HlyD family secretion protein